MNILEFADILENKTTSLSQAKKIFHRYLAGFHILSYAFTFYSGHIKSGRKLRYHFVSNALRPWHLHYLEQKYADVDRTLEEYYMGILPLFWDVVNCN